MVDVLVLSNMALPSLGFPWRASKALASLWGG